MIIGVPKEIKTNENRVALTPAGALELTKRGHTLYVQQGAGNHSGFSDQAYEERGATILPTIEEVYGKSDMIIKVKEPIASEYPLIKKDQLLFTYFHFASYEPLTKAMIQSGAVCLAYETVELPDRSLPLLVPMSEVAGRMAIQEGAKFLENQKVAVVFSLEEFQVFLPQKSWCWVVGLLELRQQKWLQVLVL